MKKINIKVPVTLSESIQACQIDLEGLKSLIAYLLSNTEYIVPQSKIDYYETKFMLKTKEYNQLKLKVEELIPEDFDKNITSWNLDFATSEVEVIEND